MICSFMKVFWVKNFQFGQAGIVSKQLIRDFSPQNTMQRTREKNSLKTFTSPKYGWYKLKMITSEINNQRKRITKNKLGENNPRIRPIHTIITIKNTRYT